MSDDNFGYFDDSGMPPRDGKMYQRQGNCWVPVVEYSLDVVTNFQDEKITLQLRKATEVLSRWVIDTREKALREALIKLGWTPPA